MTCAKRIVNAAPAVYNKSTRDLRAVAAPPGERSEPQHAPLWIFQAADGPLGYQWVESDSYEKLYGFGLGDPINKFTNHQSLGLRSSFKAGNAGAACWRVSNGTIANMELSLILTEAQIPAFQRTSDGKIVLDEVGQPVEIVPQEMATGYAARWRLSYVDDFDPVNQGSRSRVFTAAASGNPAQHVIPVMDMARDNPGSIGNNDGFRFYSIDNIDEREMMASTAYPFVIESVRRPRATASPVVVPTIFGDTTATVSFSPDAYSSIDGSSYNIVDIIKDRYSNTTDTRYELEYGAVSNNIHLYEDNISDILGMCYTAERTFLDSTSTIGIVDTLPDPSTIRDPEMERYLFNIVGGNHKGIPYHSFAFDQSATVGGVTLNEITTLWLSGAEDRPMSCYEYENAVSDVYDQYADCSNNVMDMARHIESIHYDTGFTLRLKKRMKNLLIHRPDIVVASATNWDTHHIKAYDPANNPDPLPLEWIEPEVSTHDKQTEYAVGKVLSDSFRSIPESSYWGTEAMRAIIFTANGKLRSSPWRRKVPFTFYLIPKASSYMGAGNGKWTPGKEFSRHPGNEIDDMSEASIEWIPVDTRHRFWDVSLNFPLTFNGDRLFMPALQTVYPIDGSPLNNFPTVMSIAYLYKIGWRIWRRFSGTDDLNEVDFKREVRKAAEAELEDRFAGRYIIDVTVSITADDKARNYSWTLLFSHYSGPQYTVENLSVESGMFSQLEGGQ